MADLTRPDFGEVWATEGEKLSPASAKIKLGWVREMMPYQYQNYLQARTDESLTYLFQKGIPEYSATQEYIANKSYVSYQGAIYLATATVTGVLPSVSSSWQRVSTISNASGVVAVAGGGTGATTPAQARVNLGLGTASTLNAAYVVQKDKKGNFSANTISASLNGNAATANKLKTPRQIKLVGAVKSVAASFDGSADINITTRSVDANFLSAGTIPTARLGNAVVKTSATGAAKLPKGSTLDRPPSPEFGDFRGNTTTSLLEYFNGTSWVSPQAYSSEYVLNRANHTGTQPASTITGLSVGASFTTVPETNQGPSIVVTKPHLRFMVWNGTKYVRAPWHAPGQLSYFLRNVPAGYVEVRSDVVLNKADFPDLAEYLGITATTFTLDETRGEFLRTLDSGRGVDSGRAVGSWQDSDNKSHTHTGWAASAGDHSHEIVKYNNGRIRGLPITTTTTETFIFDRGDTGDRFNMGVSFSGAHTHTVTVGSSGGTESRPRNRAYRLAVQY